MSLGKAGAREQKAWLGVGEVASRCQGEGGKRNLEHITGGRNLSLHLGA